MRLIPLVVAAVVLGVPTFGDGKGLVGGAEVLFDGQGTAHVVAGTVDGPVVHAAASSDDGWSVERLRGTAFFPPAVAFGESERGVVVWSEFGDGVRAASTGDPPGSMSTLLDPAPAAPTVSVVVAGDGTTVAAWSSDGQLKVALRTRGASAWSRPERLARANVWSLDRPLQLVRDGDGATVVWLDSRNVQGRLWARRWSPTTRRWAPAVAVSPAAPSVQQFVTASDGAGRVAVLWIGGDGTHLRQRVGSLWEPIQRVSAPGGQDPALALGPANTGVAAWSTAGRIAVLRRSDGGWGAVAPPADAAGAAACNPAVAVHEERIALAWVSVRPEDRGCVDGGNQRERVSLLVAAVGRPALGSVRWSPTAELDSDAHSPVLASSRQGAMVLTWARAGWSSAVVATARQGDVWSPPTELTHSGGPAPFVASGAPTLTKQGWRVRISNLRGGRINTRLIAVGPGRSWQRAVRAVPSGPRRTDLQLGHLAPGTYRLFSVQDRGNGPAVIADRVFTTQFHGLTMSVGGGRVSVVVPLPPRTGVGVRLEPLGRRAAAARQSRGGAVRAQVTRLTVGPVPRGRYTLRVTAIGPDRRRVQLERVVAIG